MIPAILLSALFIISALFFFYALDLILFLHRENRRFEREKNKADYPALLEKKMKRNRHPQQKNYLLFLYAQSLKITGKADRAPALEAMIRPDLLLGIKKSNAS